MRHRTKGGLGVTGINKPRGLLNIIVRRSLLILENVTRTWTNGQEDWKHDPWLYGQVGNQYSTSTWWSRTYGAAPQETQQGTITEWCCSPSTGRATPADTEMIWNNRPSNNHSYQYNYQQTSCPRWTNQRTPAVTVHQWEAFATTLFCMKHRKQFFASKTTGWGLVAKRWINK